MWGMSSPVAICPGMHRRQDLIQHMHIVIHVQMPTHLRLGPSGHQMRDFMPLQQYTSGVKALHQSSLACRAEQ